MSRAVRGLAFLAAAALPALAAPRALTLEDAVELAFGSEPTLAQARIALERSRLALLRAQLDRVSLRADGQLQEVWHRTDIAGSSQQGTLGLSNLSASLTVPLFSGFRVVASVARARELKAAADAELAVRRKDIALAVARAYWSVRRLVLLHDVEAASIARLAEAEAVAGARVKAGLAPPIDRNRATARKLAFAAELANLEGQLHEGSSALAVVLGLSEPIVLSDEPTVPERAVPDDEALVASARRSRPELRLGDALLAAQSQAVRVASAGYYPQLDVFGVAQAGNSALQTALQTRTAAGVASPFGGMGTDVQAGVALSMNLFDTFNTRTAVGDARYELARLAHELRRAERTVESDVRVASARMRRLGVQREQLVSALDIARDNLAILKKRYENGEALVIELLEAELERASAERQLTDVTAQLHLAHLELKAALGTVIGERT